MLHLSLQVEGTIIHPWCGRLLPVPVFIHFTKCCCQQDEGL